MAQTFKERIRGQVNKGTRLTSAVFGGGLTDGEVTAIQDMLSQLARASLYDKPERLCAELRERHMDKEVSHEVPKDAVTGALTKEMAHKIIEDYNKSLNHP